MGVLQDPVNYKVKTIDHLKYLELEKEKKDITEPQPNVNLDVSIKADIKYFLMGLLGGIAATLVIDHH